VEISHGLTVVKASYLYNKVKKLKILYHPL